MADHTPDCTRRSMPEWLNFRSTTCSLEISPCFRARGFGGRPARNADDIRDILLRLAKRPLNQHLATAEENISGGIGVPTGADSNLILTLDPVLCDPGFTFPGGGNGYGVPRLDESISASAGSAKVAGLDRDRAAGE